MNRPKKTGKLEKIALSDCGHEEKKKTVGPQQLPSPRPVGALRIHSSIESEEYRWYLRFIRRVGGSIWSELVTFIKREARLIDGFYLGTSGTRSSSYSLCWMNQNIEDKLK